MRHIGIVLNTDGHRALVRLTGAEQCGACGACGTTAELRKTPEVEVDNPVQAKAGEEILVEFDPAQTVKSGALVFIVPILALLGGALAGSQLGGSETATLLGAMGALALSVLGVALYDRRLARENPSRPRAVEILTPGPVEKPSQGEQGDSGVVQGLLRR